MHLNDIRERKKELRRKSMQFRAALSAEKKTELDKGILDGMLSLREYSTADVLYTFVSKPEEPDTIALIRAALGAGKRVAVPRCIPETVGMEFYEIASLEELKPGTYGVLEPVPDRSCLVGTNGKAICVVPGLSYDLRGFRLGYGKGYYDRFLTRFVGPTVGFCYSGCIYKTLPRGFYDRPVDILVTEKYIRRTADTGALR